MIERIHLVTGEFPPRCGGVGDYTAALADALSRRGVDVHVWAPFADASAAPAGVRVHALPDRFGVSARRRLEEGLASNPGRVLLQYVANAMGARGANLAFCFWLLRMHRRGADVRVMFHEPYFYFSIGHPLGNGLALAQRAMAAVLLRAADVVYLSTDTWIRYLKRYAPRTTTWKTLPIAATIPAEADNAAIARWRMQGLPAGSGRLMGHFGTYGADVARPLELLASEVLSRESDVRLLCIGRNSESFVSALASRRPELRDRVQAAGVLPPAEVAAALRACDLLIQPYPDGVTTRRTSIMAGLANGVATLTTSGPLSEDVWSSSGAVALAPVSDIAALARDASSLLSDEKKRAALAAAGRQLYEERFAMDHTVHSLLAP